MKINEIAYDENNTRSVFDSGVDLDAFQTLHANYYDVKRYVGLRSEQIFKQVFGRQQITKLYSFRNRVWTFSNEKATLYCLISTLGVAWEYLRGSDPTVLLSLMEAVIDEIKKKFPEHPRRNVVTGDFRF